MATRKRVRVSSGNVPQPASGKPPTQQERKERHLYDEMKDILIDLNSRMEDDSDVYELLDQLDEIKQNAKVKQFELELLETLAWTSNETAVVDARKNLFTATKLSHYQFIAEAVDSWQEDNFMFDEGGYDCEEAEVEDDFVSRHDWIKNFSNFIHMMRNRASRKKSTRSQIKQYIRQGM